MMRSITADRLGAALDLNTRGPAQNKRIAQLFRVSPDFAGDLRRGVGWTPQRIDQAIQHFGAVFVQMVFGDMIGPARPFELSAEITALQQAVAQLRARIGGEDEAAAVADPMGRAPAADLDPARGARGHEGRGVGAAALEMAKRAR